MNDKEELQRLATACVQLKADLMRAGLFLTAQKMDEVQASIGWEIADAEGEREAKAKKAGRKPA